MRVNCNGLWWARAPTGFGVLDEWRAACARDALFIVLPARRPPLTHHALFDPDSP